MLVIRITNIENLENYKDYWSNQPLEETKQLTEPNEIFNKYKDLFETFGVLTPINTTYGTLIDSLGQYQYGFTQNGNPDLENIKFYEKIILSNELKGENIEETLLHEYIHALFNNGTENKLENKELEEASAHIISKYLTDNNNIIEENGDIIITRPDFEAYKEKGMNSEKMKNYANILEKIMPEIEDKLMQENKYTRQEAKIDAAKYTLDYLMKNQYKLDEIGLSEQNMIKNDYQKLVSDIVTQGTYSKMNYTNTSLINNKSYCNSPICSSCL